MGGLRQALRSSLRRSEFHILETLLTIAAGVLWLILESAVRPWLGAGPAYDIVVRLASGPVALAFIVISVQRLNHLKWPSWLVAPVVIVWYVF